jgi:hypothetical protein
MPRMNVNLSVVEACASVFQDESAAHSHSTGQLNTFSFCSLVGSVGYHSGMRDDCTLKIISEISKALEDLKAPPFLRGIVGSWGDTLTDEEVLTALRLWNAGQKGFEQNFT